MNKIIIFLLTMLASYSLADTLNTSEDIIQTCIESVDRYSSPSRRLQDSRYVREFSESVKFSLVVNKIGSANRFVEADKNIKTGEEILINYFNYNGDLAIFVTTPNNSRGNEILSCLRVDDNNFDTPNLYIGQPIGSFKEKYGFTDNADRLIFESEGNLLELHFHKGRLSNYSYRNFSYTGYLCSKSHKHSLLCADGYAYGLVGAASTKCGSIKYTDTTSQAENCALNALKNNTPFYTWFWLRPVDSIPAIGLLLDQNRDLYMALYDSDFRLNRNTFKVEKCLSWSLKEHEKKVVCRVKDPKKLHLFYLKSFVEVLKSEI